jgi:hypothetical protein
LTPWSPIKQSWKKTAGETASAFPVFNRRVSNISRIKIYRTKWGMTTEKHIFYRHPGEDSFPGIPPAIFP